MDTIRNKENKPNVNQISTLNQPKHINEPMVKTMVKTMNTMNTIRMFTNLKMNTMNTNLKINL